MAAPAYTTDLVDYDLAQNDAAWTEFSGRAGGGAPDEDDGDNAFQGTMMCSQSTNTDTEYVSQGTDLGGTMTIPSGNVILVWQQHTSPGAIDLYANDGMQILIGVDFSNYEAWTVGGKDVSPNPYGGWQNNAVDPNNVTRDAVVGTPGIFACVGSSMYMVNAVFKGQPHQTDAIRYGRAEARMNGGETANYATFAGFAAINDANDITDGYNRWGLIQAVSGGFLWKGMMILGYSTAVDFRDSNKVIFIQDCRKVDTGFNRIEVRQAGSRVDWNGITFINTSPTTNASRGDFEVIDDCDINFDGCVFTDMGTFIFQDTSTVLNSIFRRCNLVTIGNGVFTGCTFDSTNYTEAVYAATIAEAAKVTNSTFISGGTGYGMEIDGAAGNFTFTNVTWTGYAAQGGTATDRAIHILATTGTVNITVSGGTSPTYHSEGATVVINDDVTITFTGMKDNSEVRVYKTSDDSVIAGIEDATDGTTDNRSFAWAASATTDVYYKIHNFQEGVPVYETISVYGYVVPSLNTSIGIQQRLDRNAE